MRTKFNIGDRVTLNTADKIIEGVVEIVDANGIFTDNSQPYYDVYCEEDDTLYKHFPESSLKKSAIYKK